MTIEEIQNDEALRNRMFPVTREKIFFGHGGVCALPATVADAMCEFSRMGMRGDQESFFPARMMTETRALAARLIGASSEEIAFVGPTSLAISLIAGGLSIEPGDNIVVYPSDYPSNVYPWMALEERGAEVRYLKTRETGRIEPEDVAAAMDDRTKLVALASCHFVTGFRIDIDAIGKLVRERGAMFSLDAIQTCGAAPTRVEHVDFLAADAHKWMLGPCAAGILYVSRERWETLRPIVYGWNNVKCPEFVTQDSLELQEGARRYEAGTPNLVGLAGMRASLELLLDLGIENIFQDLLRKRARLISGISAKSEYSVCFPELTETNASGIVAIRTNSVDPQVVMDRLETGNVVASLRTDRDENQYIRFSPHFYNTNAEIDRVLEIL